MIDGEKYNALCGCVVAVEMVDDCDYGEDGRIDFKSVGDIEIVTPCRTHAAKRIGVGW